ncbi:hypothetical protein LTS18_009723 [Coniosporium uncinatum]|uniref:Uncharacterized protein n=1 Tax=Coniosporium uncinatum TaxID=93489 RepID=A0ACC3DA69_9PEZI|nr:hypothetical protein LTS18_009723 [Coniosporium uncinatum]
MSDKLMDTEVGGETSQYALFSTHPDTRSRNLIAQRRYESIQTVTKPHSKEGGQISDTPTRSDPSETGPSEDRAAKTAENIRYGQNMSESGMGGMTNQTGSANSEGGFGEETSSDGADPGQSRREQGYDAKHEMNREIGA